MIFCCGKETEFILCEGNYIDFILLHVSRYNETIQKPHDHLFQKSELLGVAVFLQNQYKSDFFCCGKVSEFILCEVSYIYFILLHVSRYNGTTQKPKSELLGLAVFLPKQRQSPKK